MKKSQMIFTSLIAAVAVTVAVTLAADDKQPTTGKTSPDKATMAQLVHRTNYMSYYQGDDGRAKVHMTIVDKNGNKRNREFTILRKDQRDPNLPKDADKEQKQQADKQFTEGQKFYIYFERPADVNRMAYLVWKHLNKDDDRWLYLPSVDSVQRIAAGDKRTSFVGSDFFYEDISGRNIDADTRELLETTKDYYVLKNTPKDPDSVEFSYYKAWIHKPTGIVVQASYYDKDGKEYRRYNALDTKEIQGYRTVTKSRMTDLRSGGHTDLVYTDVKYNLGLDDNIFSERYLRQPPMHLLK